MKVYLGRAFGAGRLGGVILAVFMGAWSTAAHAQGVTTIQSPTGGSTVTCQGSQQSISIEIVIDRAWSYDSYTLNQVVGGVTNFKQNTGDTTPVSVFDNNGSYLYTIVSIPRPQDGSGYQIIIQVFQMVSDGKGGEIKKTAQVQVNNVTVKTQ